MTNTLELMILVYIDDLSYSEFSLNSSELFFNTISLLKNFPSHFNLITEHLITINALIPLVHPTFQLKFSPPDWHVL